MLLTLRSDWTVGGTTYPQDALLAIDLDDFLAGSRDFDVLFEPAERVSLGSVSHDLEPPAAHHARQRPRPPLPAHSRRRRLDEGGDRAARPRHRRPRQHRRRRRQLLLHLHRLPDALEPLPRAPTAAQPKQVKSSPAWFDADGHDGRPVRGDLGGRHQDPVLRLHAEGLRGQRRQPDPALRLRRLRGLAGARATPARDRHRLGRARRRLRPGQHPRRRRVRTQVAPGRGARRSTRTTSTTSSPSPRT